MLDDSVRQPLGGGAVGVGGDDRQLVAAVARDHVLAADRAANDARTHRQHEVAVLVAELVVDGFEEVVVDQEHRERHIAAVGPRESPVKAAPELAGVGEPGQAVRRGLLAAAVVAQGVGDRDGGAAGQGVDGEEVLVGERPRDLAEQDQHRRSVAGRDRHDHSRAVGREDSLPGACGL